MATCKCAAGLGQQAGFFRDSGHILVGAEMAMILKVESVSRARHEQHDCACCLIQCTAISTKSASAGCKLHEALSH